MKSIGGRAFIVILVAFTSPVWGIHAEGKQNTGQASPSIPGNRSQWSGVDCTDLLRQLDADRDGVIVREEWDRFFSKHDENGDNILTQEEIRPKAGRSSSEETADSGRIAAFERLDKNHNDAIDFSEWPGKERDFRYIDSDHNGSLSREEFLSRNGRWWNETFENLDFDGDGAITRSEWLDSDASFDKLDRDHNGVIVRAEFYNPR